MAARATKSAVTRRWRAWSSSGPRASHGSSVPRSVRLATRARSTRPTNAPTAPFIESALLPHTVAQQVFARPFNLIRHTRPVESGVNASLHHRHIWHDDPRPFRPLPNGLPPRRRRAHRPLQLALRAPHGWEVLAPHRGHG